MDKLAMEMRSKHTIETDIKTLTKSKITDKGSKKIDALF